MPEDRLAELRRQRALIQEHLVWLDLEIAAAEKAGGYQKGPIPIASPASQEKSALVLPASAALGASVAPRNENAVEQALDPIEAQAETVMEKYRIGTGDLQQNIRRGCFLYFAAALTLLAAIVAGLYFALRH